MFICAVTQTSAPSGEKPTKLVVETRERTYDFHEDGHCNLQKHHQCRHGEIIFQSRGVEIVKEINVSAEGMKRLEAIRAGVE